MMLSAASNAHGLLLGWIPFIQPLNIFHEWWYLLLLPLALGISIIYKAVRMPTLSGFGRQVAAMTAQVVLAMIALAIVMMLLVQVVIPWLPAE